MASEAPMASEAIRSSTSSGLAERVHSIAHRWSGYALMSIATTAAFLGVSFWWLTVNRAIPIWDAGLRLSQAIIVYEHLRAGQIGTALTTTVPYPPFAYLVGAAGIWIGGLGPAQPVIAENLVFVPLLALGCYHVARMAFGARAGFLAVVFGLGTPLVTAQFHVFMVDVPETAMVAVSIWLILASQRFSRLWISALAGLAVGLGMLTKEPFLFFVSGVVLVALLRGGWRQWRGLIAFFGVAMAIALPWYIETYSQVHSIASAAVISGGQESASGIVPPVISLTNLLWYFWNTVNAQLYAPLFAISIVGAVWMVYGLVRRRPVSPLAWEIVVGAFVSWLAITVTFPHDTRYGMPLLLYLAVFGAGWVASLRRPLAAGLGACALIAFALANNLATSFGVGTEVLAKLPGAELSRMEGPGLVRIYSNGGFLVSAPHRDGDVLGLMQTLHDRGVRGINWIDLGSKELPPSFSQAFSEAGLLAFASIAGLQPLEAEPFSRYSTQDAVLGHGPVSPGESPPCVRLADGSGVWVRLGNPDATGAKYYCPYRHPAFY